MPELTPEHYKELSRHFDSILLDDQPFLTRLIVRLFKERIRVFLQAILYRGYSTSVIDAKTWHTLSGIAGRAVMEDEKRT